MSRKYQEEFLIEQIAEYNRLLIDGAGAKSNTRQPQPHEDHREAEGRTRGKTEKPARRGKKDDGLVFDESESIICSSTRPTSSRIRDANKKWSASPASRPADLSVHSTST